MLRKECLKLADQLDFTGERVVPDDVTHKDLYFEHIARYAFASQFTSGKTVLDVGCGTGYGSAFLACSGATSVVAGDISEDAIAYAMDRFQLSNLNYSLIDATTLQFENQSFDVCVSFEVIEHLEDDESYLSEVYRVLKDEGIFIVSTPNKLLSSPEVEKPYNPFHIREYTAEHLLRTLSNQFPHVQLFGQGYAEGFDFILNENEPELASYLPAASIPYSKDERSTTPFNGLEAKPSIQEPPFFVAVCSKMPVTPRSIHIGLSGMDTLAETVRARNEWIEILIAEKDQRDHRIIDLEDTLRQREEWTKILVDEKGARDARITDLEGTLKSREDWIAILIDEKKVRDERIADLEDTISRQEESIQRLIAEQRDRDQQVATMEESLSEHEQRLAERTAMVVQLETENATLREEIAALNNANIWDKIFFRRRGGEQ